MSECQDGGELGFKCKNQSTYDIFTRVVQHKNLDADRPRILFYESKQNEESWTPLDQSLVQLETLLKLTTNRAAILCFTCSYTEHVLEKVPQTPHTNDVLPIAGYEI